MSKPRASGSTWAADNFYGEDRGLKQGLRTLGVPYVMALKPSHAWWHPEDVAGSLKDVAHEAGWQNAESSTDSLDKENNQKEPLGAGGENPISPPLMEACKTYNPSQKPIDCVRGTM